MASMILVLQDLLGNYQKTECACKRTDISKREPCDAMALGSLLKAAQKARLWPFPEPPYEGFTVKGLKEAILAVEVKTFCDITNPGCGLDYHRGQNILGFHAPPNYNQPAGTTASHAIKESIRSKINSVSDKLCGLKIEGFR